MEVVNFPRTRLVTPWNIRHLDVSYLLNMLVQRCDEIPLHALHMIDIILILEVRTIYFDEELQRFACVREEVMRIFKDVERLDHHTKTSGGGLISGPGKILAHPFHLLLTALPRDGISDERVELGTSHLACKFKSCRHICLELLLPTGVIEKTSLSTCHVTGVKVHQGNSQPRGTQPFRGGGKIFSARPPELHGSKAKTGSAFKPL